MPIHKCIPISKIELKVILLMLIVVWIVTSTWTSIWACMMGSPLVLMLMGLVLRLKLGSSPLRICICTMYILVRSAGTPLECCLISFIFFIWIWLVTHLWFVYVLVFFRAGVIIRAVLVFIISSLSLPPRALILWWIMRSSLLCLITILKFIIHALVN